MHDKVLQNQTWLLKTKQKDYWWWKCTHVNNRTNKGKGKMIPLRLRRSNYEGFVCREKGENCSIRLFSLSRVSVRNGARSHGPLAPVSTTNASCPSSCAVCPLSLLCVSRAQRRQLDKPVDLPLGVATRPSTLPVREPRGIGTKGDQRYRSKHRKG